MSAESYRAVYLSNPTTLGIRKLNGAALDKVATEASDPAKFAALQAFSVALSTWVAALEAEV